MELSGTK